MNKLPRSSFSHLQSSTLSQSTTISQTIVDANQVCYDSPWQGMCSHERNLLSKDVVAFTANMATPLLPHSQHHWWETEQLKFSN